MRTTTLWLFACLVSSVHAQDVSTDHKSDFTQDEFWVPTRGPYGGFVHSLAKLPGGHVFAGTREGHLYQSVDRGLSWSISGLSILGVNVVAAQFDTCLYVGGTYGGIYRSSDGGTTWSGQLTSVLANAFLFTSNGNVVVGTDASGMFRSTNNGLSWEPIGSLRVFSFAKNLQEHLFAGALNGLFRSTDLGDSWELILNVPIVTEVLVSQDQNILATYQDSLYRSTDNGTSWMASSLSTSVLSSLASDTTDHLFAGTYSGELFLSGDNGDSWERLDSLEGGQGNSIKSIETDSIGLLYVGTGGLGFFRSDSSGRNLSRSIDGMSNTDVWSLAISPGGVIYAGTFADGVQLSTDQGEHWNGTQVVDPWVRVVALDSLGRVFAGVGEYLGSGRLYVSTDEGQSWTQIFSNDWGVKAVAVDSNGTIFVGTLGNGMYRSTDSGLTWEQINDGLTNHSIYSLSINHTGTVFAGTNSGVFRSTNDGNTWIYKGPIQDFIYALAVDLNGDILAGVSHDCWSSGIYRSSNNGDSWTSIGLTCHAVFSMSLDGNGTILVCADDGVYRSTTGGGIWEQFNSGLPTNYCNCVELDSVGNGFAGVYMGGAYRSSGPVSHVTEKPLPLPRSVTLEQTFPNPFNSKTSIRWSIPRPSEVTLKIFNILGEEIAILVAGPMNAGTHTLQWDAANHPSGVYFCRLQVEGFAMTNKLILLR